MPASYPKEAVLILHQREKEVAQSLRIALGFVGQ